MLRSKVFWFWHSFLHHYTFQLIRYWDCRTSVLWCDDWNPIFHKFLFSAMFWFKIPQPKLFSENLSKIAKFLFKTSWHNRTVFENHRKSHSTLRAMWATFTFLMAKSSFKRPNWSTLVIYWKPEASSQTVLPDRTLLMEYVKMRHFE